MDDMIKETNLAYDLIPAKKTYTYDGYVKLPEGTLCQLIGGEFIMTPAPGKTHQILSKSFHPQMPITICAKSSARMRNTV